jgi:hypothetical protein
MVAMMRARRPRRVHEGIMEMLLNLLDDLPGVCRRVAAIQSAARRGLDNDAIVSGTHGGGDVPPQQGHHALLVRRERPVRRDPLAIGRARSAHEAGGARNQVIAA